ncbi:putative ABC transporter ATP-binding protein y4gM [Bienertia sinuspersici]
MSQHSGRDEPIGRVSMLDVMNPSEVLGHHAGRAESNTFRLSLDGSNVPISRLSLSLTAAMGQHARRDKPIKGVRYLALVDREVNLPNSSTRLAVRPSLLCPSNRAESLVHSQNFRKNMSTMLKLNNMDAYVLQNMMPDRDATNDKPPLLARSILSGATKWKSNIVKFIGDSFFIPDYWNGLKMFSLDMETSTNFIQFMTQFMLLFNLMTEAQTSCVLFVKADVGRQTAPYHGWRALHFFVGPLQARQYTDAPPKSTHNPSGKLADQPPEWQFGFCQDIPSAITRNVQDRSNVSYDKGTGDNVCAASSKRLYLTRAMDEVEGEDKSTSDAESEINFKHHRGRSKKPRTTDLKGDETDFGNAFDNIPIPSDIPIDLTKILKWERHLMLTTLLIEEAIKPLNVHIDRTVPRKGKGIHIERDLVESSNPASPAQTHHSVDGLSTAPSHGDPVPAPSISTIRVTPVSQGIFTSAIKILENEYLTLRKQTPFDKVSDRHGEASQVYKAIRMMHGDPEPLKCKVDEYVWAVKGHLALKASFYDAVLTKHQGLEEESVALKKKEYELLKELEDVRQQMGQVTNDIGNYRGSLTTLEATVHATKRRVELEAVPMCSAEEMELFKEQERKLLEFQSSLDSFEWIM